MSFTITFVETKSEISVFTSITLGKQKFPDSMVFLRSFCRLKYTVYTSDYPDVLWSITFCPNTVEPPLGRHLCTAFVSTYRRFSLMKAPFMFIYYHATEFFPVVSCIKTYVCNLSISLCFSRLSLNLPNCGHRRRTKRRPWYNCWHDFCRFLPIIIIIIIIIIIMMMMIMNLLVLVTTVSV